MLTPTKMRVRVSPLEELCQHIDDENYTGGHFVSVFREKLAVNGIFTPEYLSKFDSEKWSEKFGLNEGQVMVLKDYVLAQKNKE